MKLYLLLGLSLLLAGCDSIQSTPVPVGANTGRFEVESSQQFIDGRGYSRNIILLKDSKTGHEYLAVMGAGVVDVYQSGKYTHED